MGSNYKSYDLNHLVHTYNIDNMYEQYKRFEFIKKLGIYTALNNSRILEFGSATGQMTLILSKLAKQVVAVDGSREFIKIARERVKGFANVTFHESCFESLALEGSFDCLIFHHILEHIENPVNLLRKSSSFMSKDSLIAISVPNAYALSRQLAVKMGLLESVYALTENDKNHGHFRVYDRKLLEDEVIKSGLTVIGRHGLSLKLFSDKQNIEMLNANIIGEDQIKGLWNLADELLDYAGAIMIVAKRA